MMFGIFVYLGTKGFLSLMNLVNAATEGGESDRRNGMLDQRLLKVAFVDQAETDETVRAFIRAADIRCRRHRQWTRVCEMRQGAGRSCIGIRPFGAVYEVVARSSYGHLPGYRGTAAMAISPPPLPTT
jgi:hypothetical protein